MLKLVVFLLLCGIIFVHAEVIAFQKCRPEGNCVINEVRVDPCPEAKQDKSCKVKRGRSATIEYDYTPGFSSNDAFATVYWVNNDVATAFPTMNTNACNFTTCPIEKDKKNTYSFTLQTDRTYSVRSYTIQWVLHDKEKPETSDDLCCFQMGVKVIN